MRTTLLLAALVTFASAALCLYLGAAIRRRVVANMRSRAANDAFQIWWFGFAALTAIAGLRELLAAFDVLDRGIHAALVFLTIPLLAFALYGLVYYFAYLAIGDARLRVPTMAFHAAFGLALFMLIVWMHPLEAKANRWTTTIRYEHEPGGWILVAIIVPLLAPTIIGALAYFSIFFRVKDRLARYRIGLVSGSVLVWFGTVAVASAVGWTRHPDWPLVSRGLAFTATLLILLAYRPPRGLEARLSREVARA